MTPFDPHSLVGAYVDHKRSTTSAQVIAVDTLGRKVSLTIQYEGPVTGAMNTIKVDMAEFRRSWRVVSR